MPKDTTRPTTSPPAPDGFAPRAKVGGEQRGHKLPNYGERTRYFMLGAHPTSWELAETSKGWLLVPTLKRLIVQAGVNFTHTAPAGQAPDASDLEAKARSRFGQTVLHDPDEYLYVTQGATGPGHFLLWENVKTYPDGTYEVSFDQDGYDLWRWSLVERGRIEPPRESMISQIRTRLMRAKNRATRTPHLAQAQEAQRLAETRLEGLAKALSALHALAQRAA